MGKVKITVAATAATDRDRLAPRLSAAGASRHSRLVILLLLNLRVTKRDLRVSADILGLEKMISLNRSVLGKIFVVAPPILG